MVRPPAPVNWLGSFWGRAGVIGLRAPLVVETGSDSTCSEFPDPGLVLHWYENDLRRGLSANSDAPAGSGDHVELDPGEAGLGTFDQQRFNEFVGNPLVGSQADFEFAVWFLIGW